MDFKNAGIRIAIVLVVVVLMCAWLWQPGRQLRLRQQRLLKAFERRDWDAVSAMVDDQYADRWNHTKSRLVEDSRQVFSQFLFVNLEHEVVDSSIEGQAGRAQVRVKIRGQGGPIAVFAMERVNALRQPFTFEWSRRSWKPWDWTLVRADQPELEIPQLSDLAL